MKKEKYNFNGFKQETIKFLLGLKQNNNKAWFEKHRQDYQEYLLKPFQSLVADMSTTMLSLDPGFETRPYVNKTISRIYRDIRFSRDKSPFRPNMWITFKRPQKGWYDAPAYFFELSYDSYRYGMGYYTASSRELAWMRSLIDEGHRDFKEILEIYKSQNLFVLEGEQYKRIMDKNKPEEINNWYQRKNMYFVRNKDIDDTLFSQDLIPELDFAFALLKPFYDFFWKLREH